MQETFVKTRVIYTVKVGDQLYVVENVPARVCKETGEQLFSPETVEHLQQLIAGNTPPQRTIQTPVYDYASS
ncbi:MAG: YgiT-type zinc finger protein [Chitinivibrionales bacterium]|nr:YgiT-type zinc finger protein [Chitinivibrionales bacterium]